MIYFNEFVDFNSLNGQTIKSVESMESGSGEVYFHMQDGTTYKMYHEQDCCENVYLADVCGDPNDLIDAKIITAEERSESCRDYEDYESVTYTFYDIQTNKGCVNLRWVGSSNGYYSESVGLAKTN